VKLPFQRKEKELAAVAAKIEDEQSLGIKMQKQVKELSVSFLLRGEKQFLPIKKLWKISLKI
jgi:hypothetical protein